MEDEEKDFVCGQCGKKYYVEENFKIHRVWHKEEGVKKWGCAGCDQRWKSEDKFNKHLEKCLGKQWECEKCGVVFGGGAARKGGKKAWERHLAGGGCEKKVEVVEEESEELEKMKMDFLESSSDEKLIDQPIQSEEVVMIQESDVVNEENI